ncbi:MAG: ankyrin repeat domain-containing protein [Alphaproteobacteria bacterium]
MGFSLSSIFNWLKPKPVAPPAPVAPPPPAVLQLPNLYQKQEAEIVTYIQQQLKTGATLQDSDALHAVCEQGWLQAAKLLMDAGADINRLDFVHAHPPFTYAASSGNPDLIDELLKRGATSNAVDKDKHNAIYHFFVSSYRYSEHYKTPEGRERDKRAFKTLLDLGLEVEPVMDHYIYYDRHHLAPLRPQVEKTIAFETAIKAKDYAAVHQMMEDGMNPDAGAEMGGVAGLRIAAGQNDLRMMGMLMAAGADIKRFSNGFDALHSAAISGAREAFVKVVGAGVNTDGDIYAYDRYEDTTIVQVAGMCQTDPGMVDFVKDVLARKAEVMAEYEATKQKFLHPYDDIKLVTDHEVAVRKPLHFRLRASSPAAS